MLVYILADGDQWFPLCCVIPHIHFSNDLSKPYNEIFSSGVTSCISRIHRDYSYCYDYLYL